LICTNSGTVQEQLRCLELQSHVCELPLQALELAQRSAELIPIDRVLVSKIVGVTTNCKRAGSVADTLCIEGGDLAFESARAKYQVALRHLAVFKE
jgi:hypothetical protein